MTLFIRFVFFTLWFGFSVVGGSRWCVQAQSAQEPKQPSPPPAPATQETFRISTVLVQTDVSVLDAQGRFVEGLPREAFELKVDGKPLPVALFQRVTAGSTEEAANLAAARGQRNAAQPVTTNPLTRGQSVIFFVDDYHLEPEHVERAQKIIHHYLDHNLRAGDRAMIASSTGQLGFLQQFSDYRPLLQMATNRLKFQPQTKLDTERPTISLYEATGAVRNQADVMEYLVQQYRTQSTYTKTPQGVLRQVIRQRANNILQYNKQMTTAMFSTLEGLLRGVAEVPGRKLLFFISAGFIIDPTQDSSLPGKLQRLIDWAGHAGVVCYTVDARGLQVALPDISEVVTPSLAREASNDTNTSPIDATSLVHGEMLLTQQTLRTLAYETGGRPLLNNNGLETLVDQTIREYQNYYVVAWEPETFEKDQPKFKKVEVTIKGRPELRVRVRRGFFGVPNKLERTEKPSSPTTPTTPAQALAAALRESTPRQELPLALTATFVSEAEAGSAVIATVEMPGAALAEAGGKAEIEIYCALIDSHGKVTKYEGKQLSFNRPAQGAANLVAHFRLPANTGFHQVRAIARDQRSGRMGADYQWLNVPNFAPNKLALSSLLLNEQPAASTSPVTTLTTGRHFARSSKLLLQLYLYNAPLNTTARRPDLTAEIHVRRGNQAVLDAPAHPVALNDQTDLTRILYAAEIPLRGLTPGLYSLQVKITDNVKKAVEEQSLNFVVE